MFMLTQLGRFLGLFGLCFFLIGFVHSSSLMYMVGLFSVGVLLTAAVLAFRSVRDIECERDIPSATVYSGDPVDGRIRIIERRSRWRMLELFDQHTNLVSGHTTRRRMTLMTEGRNAPAVVGGVRQVTRHSGRGQIIEVRDPVRFSRRGLYKLGPLTIHGYDPFGLLYQSRTISLESELIVYPRPLPMTESVMGGLGARRQTEVRPVGRAGESADFHGIRPYVQGDDLRHVHWKATAHSGNLTIKQYEYRASGAVQVVLDLQRGQHLGEREYSSLEASITLAASVLSHVLGMGNNAGLIATSAELQTLAPESGERQLHRALEMLALAKDDGAIPLSNVLAGSESQYSRRCTTVVISATTEMNLIGALLALQGRSTQVLLVLLDARSYADAEMQDRPKHSLLTLASSPLDLKKSLEVLVPSRRRLPDEHAHATLAQAAAAAGIEVYSIGASLPLHQALQGIRMRM